MTEEELYEGISVDFKFTKTGPVLGDLFTICGYENPNFPPLKKYPFEKLTDLQFSQIDDYFGVQNLSDEGDDVVIWLYPLIDDEIVDHHTGPFEGLRISYNILRNPSRMAKHLYLVIQKFEEILGVSSSVSLENVKEKVNSIQQYWTKKNITPGSVEALEID